MDNYCIPTGAPNAAGAHAWINWSIIPEISIKDLSYHGYHTGMKNMSQLISEIAPDLEKGDMIFFGAEQVKTFETQVIDKSIDRLVDILGKAKAKAGA
jgi:spermidine/putrescine transport system substrate-binding protein